MKKHYHHLSTTERVTLMLMQRQGASLRVIARDLNRSPSTLSRELRRHALQDHPYERMPTSATRPPRCSVVAMAGKVKPINKEAKIIIFFI